MDINNQINFVNLYKVEYFSVRKTTKKLKRPLPKGVPQRLIDLGFMETEDLFLIPIQHLTNKLPIAV
jgi:hypothetical protein